MKGVVRAFCIALAAGLAGYLTWDRVEVHQLDADIRGIAARGEPTDLAAAERSPATAQEREAAELYAEAASRARDVLEQDARFTRVDLDAVVGRVDVGEIESTFRKDAPALQLLDRATPLPFAGFADVDDDRFAIEAGLQTLSGLAALRADLLAYHGEGDAAAQALAAVVRMRRTLPDLAYNSTLASRAFGSLRILLRHAAPSAAALEALQHAVVELPDDDGLARDLTLRRALLIENRGAALQPPGISTISAFVLHPFLVRTLRIQIEQFPEAIAAAREPWPDKFGTLTALASADDNRPGRSSLRRVVMGPHPNLAALAASPTRGGLNLAVRRLALVTLAVERFRRVNGGRPPAALDELVPAFLAAVPVDPFSGRPLVYRLKADSYVVYSVDVNRVDDGGSLYGFGSMQPMPLPRARDFGIRVPLTPSRGAQ